MPIADGTAIGGGVATAVLEEDRLLAASQGRLELLQQAGSKVGLQFALLKLPFGIGQDDFRHGQAAEAFGHRHQSVFPRLGVGKRFQGRRGRAQHRFSALQVRQINSRITGIVAGVGLVLFVRVVVFFIHDDEP